MIVRAQFVEWGTGKKKEIHNWSLFSVDEKNDLRQIFDDIYDKKIMPLLLHQPTNAPQI